MRPSPSIVPGSVDRDTYLVLDDFGRVGRAWAETDEDHTSLDAVVTDLLDGQYRRPVRVIAFNTVEGWSRDVWENVSHLNLQEVSTAEKFNPAPRERHFATRASCFLLTCQITKW